jgi:hypothetical protein
MAGMRPVQEPQGLPRPLLHFGAAKGGSQQGLIDTLGRRWCGGSPLHCKARERSAGEIPTRLLTKALKGSNPRELQRGGH